MSAQDYLEIEALSFDDVLLIPTISEVASRSEIDLLIQQTDDIPDGDDVGDYPVFTAPMSSVISEDNLKRFSGRFIFPILLGIPSKKLNTPFGVALRLKDLTSSTFLDLENSLGKHEGCVKLLCLDLANGYMLDKIDPGVMDKFHALAERFNCKKMIGNVVTGEGVSLASKHGFDYVRIGIGGGSACTTQVVTGVGCPTLTALSLCDGDRPLGIKIVADGGVRGPAEAIKSFAFGADHVMMGGYFAGCVDSPGFDPVSSTAPFYGEASARAKGTSKFVEGASGNLMATETIESRIDHLEDGLRSSLSYLGFNSITELIENRESVKFIKLTASGRVESKPHRFV